MTGQGWVWLGSDGLTAVTPTNQTKAAEAMLGSVGIMPTGTLHFNSVTLALPEVGNGGLSNDDGDGNGNGKKAIVNPFTAKCGQWQISFSKILRNK